MDTRMAFSDSNDVSGGSCSTCCAGTTTESSLSPSRDLSPDVEALKRLSDTLESICFNTSTPMDFDFFADAKLIVADGREIAVHRCILSARSLFFKNFFMNKERNATLELKEVMKEYDVGYDALVTVLSYVYSGKVRVSHKDFCVCVDDECSHLACRPAVAFMAEVLYASFFFQIKELVDRFQRQLMDILDKAAADDVLMVLSVANMCGTACKSLLVRSTEIIVKSDVDIITLDKALPRHLVETINDSRFELGLQSSESNNFPDKHVKRIHRALESDDVELVRMLLKEGHTNLDDAYALHFAVAYCDAKTTTELLDLAIADINRRNPRGYTVLHVAAMRKEPNIIVSLLTKGARSSDLTSDGRKALQILKRLTRAVDYNKSTEEGKSTPKDRLCIEILEQAERRDPLLGEASMSLAVAGDNLRTKLLYLENRVAMAKLLFPMEAKVAMDIAQVDGTSEFPFKGTHKNMSGAQGTGVDLNEAPFKIKEEHLNRLRALSKTVAVSIWISEKNMRHIHFLVVLFAPLFLAIEVSTVGMINLLLHHGLELGKRFFPRCSAVLNKIMDGDDYSEIAQLGNNYDEECPLKKQRRLEIEDVFSKAFTEDKEEFDRTINFSSSSSSSSVGMMRPNSKLTFKK